MSKTLDTAVVVVVITLKRRSVLLSLNCNVLSTYYLEILLFGAFLFMKTYNIHSMRMPQDRGNFSFPTTHSQKAVRAYGNGESIKKIKPNELTHTETILYVLGQRV